MQGRQLTTLAAAVAEAMPLPCKGTQMMGMCLRAVQAGRWTPLAGPAPTCPYAVLDPDELLSRPDYWAEPDVLALMRKRHNPTVATG
jgi:hypothetical protein